MSSTAPNGTSSPKITKEQWKKHLETLGGERERERERRQHDTKTGILYILEDDGEVVGGEAREMM